MAVIERDEATAARRRVPFRLFLSDGTSPDTGALNDAIIVAVNSLQTFSANSTARAIESAQGMYALELTASEVSVLGNHALYHTVGDFPQHVANFRVVNHNPYSTQSNVTAVTVLAGNYSSGVTFGAGTFAPGTYSTVTFSVDQVETVLDKTGYTIAAGAYSNVTFSTGGQASSSVTLAPGTHSSATVQGVTRTLNLTTNDDKTGYALTAAEVQNIAGASASSTWRLSVTGFDSTASFGGAVSRFSSSVNSVGLAAQTHSAATVGGIATAGIVAASFAASSIDAVALATDAGQEIADRVLTRNIAGGSDSGRTVSEALYALRNRVQISATSYIVYQTDDTTIAWFASKTTTDAHDFLTSIDPA